MADKENEATIYHFYVKPLDANTNENFVDYLHSHNEQAATVGTMRIIVNGEPVLGVYEVKHAFITELAKGVHKNRVRVYVRAGGGEARLYRNSPTLKRKLAKEKPVQAVLEVLEGLKKA